jgi:hypothetical protein
MITYSLEIVKFSTCCKDSKDLKSQKIFDLLSKIRLDFVAGIAFVLHKTLGHAPCILTNKN